MPEDTRLDLARIQKDYDTLMNLVNRVTNLVGANQSVNNMKKDVIEVYNMIVKSLSPFYSINDQLEFDRDFNSAYSNFDKNYLSAGQIDDTKLNEFHISCTKLENDLKDLFAITNDKELGDIIGKQELWFQNDYLSHKRVHNFLSKLNNGLKNINSYSDLQLLLSDKYEFENLRRTLAL